MMTCKYKVNRNQSKTDFFKAKEDKMKEKEIDSFFLRFNIYRRMKKNQRIFYSYVSSRHIS